MFILRILCQNDRYIDYIVPEIDLYIRLNIFHRHVTGELHPELIPYDYQILKLLMPEDGSKIFEIQTLQLNSKNNKYEIIS